MIPPERIVLYVHALADLSNPQLAHGFDKALKLFKPEYGNSFPTPAQIREWAFQWRPPEIQENRHILDRGDKPPDWEPLAPGELTAMQQEAHAKAELLQREVAKLAKEKAMPSGKS
jgi:hypothetical protein